MEMETTLSAQAYDLEIKMFLDAPDEASQRLGLMYANMHGWSNYDIGKYLIESGRNWNVSFKYNHNVDDYKKMFLGGSIEVFFDAGYLISRVFSVTIKFKFKEYEERFHYTSYRALKPQPEIFYGFAERLVNKINQAS